MKPARIDQILSSYGYCSRREAPGWIKAGRVCVQGRPVKSRSEKADPKDVSVDGEPLPFPEGVLIMMHKPLGLVCSHEEREGPNIYSLLPEAFSRRNPRPESVGRLDKDTSGLIMITDDGKLNHRWTSPNHKVDKVYEVTVDKPLNADLVPIFAAGDLVLDDEEKPCQPAQLELTGERTANLILREGKYHQVRRMFASQGYHVEALHRSAFGPYVLGDLEPGSWKTVDCLD